MNRPKPLLVTSLESIIWLDLHAELEMSLNRLDLAHLSSPSMLILHNFIDCAVSAMHREVFLQLVEADFGVSMDGNKENIEVLYQAEVTEHGSRNISQYCEQNGWHITVSFPFEADAIVSIRNPVEWDIAKCKTAKLVDALGLQWHEDVLEGPSEGSIFTLKKQSAKLTSVKIGDFLDDVASLNSVQRIYDKLGCGVIMFSSVGRIIAMSRSVLTSVKLAVDDTSMASFCAAIPFGFYNDIVWSVVPFGDNGVFENYRVRMRLFGGESVSVLFNVSGYRDGQSIIHTLWQIVSLAGGSDNLSEGSILSDARVHKITRNYVPQLVEEKAREAVRLGKDKLTNEECFVAILFCDIVGFTSYVEGNAGTESVINTLNVILRRVSGSVKRHNGAIDKFMGDSVMAIFRDPADALLAGLEMQSHSADINNLRSRAGQDALQLRIGMHCGAVVIGNVGTAERLDWTAIGDVVNTASRIEKLCKPGSVLISQAMRDAIDLSHHPAISLGKISHISIRGKRETLSVCYIKHSDARSDHRV